jgi:cytochrome b6-f complex iron-sulfur subunit
MNDDVETKGCDITRRHALQIAIKGSLVLVMAGLGSGEAEAATWEQVGTTGQFTVGTPRRLTLKNGQVIFVTRQDKTHWLALSARCTHEGGEVRWETKQKRFVCPLHGASFALTGKDPKGAARAPLATYPIQLKGASVQIDTAKLDPGPKMQHREGDDEDDEHGRKDHEHGRKHESGKRRRDDDEER